MAYYGSQYVTPVEEEPVPLQGAPATAAPVAQESAAPAAEPYYGASYTDPAYTPPDSSAAPASAPAETTTPQQPQPTPIDAVTNSPPAAIPQKAAEGATGIGNWLGDQIEKISPDARQKLSGFGLPIGEVQQAEGIKDKLLTAADYWDRPQQYVQEEVGDTVSQEAAKPPVDESYDLTDPGDWGRMLGQAKDQVTDYVRHPEHAISAIGEDMAEDTAVFGDQGFEDWAREHPEAREAAGDDGDALYQMWLDDIGYTLDSGGVLGLGKGLVQQMPQDPTAAPSVLLSGGLGMASKGLINAGKVGTARGMLTTAKAVNTAVGGPEDLLLDAGASLATKAARKLGVGKIFSPSDETARTMQVQAADEVARGTAQDIFAQQDVPPTPSAPQSGINVPAPQQTGLANAPGAQPGGGLQPTPAGPPPGPPTPSPAPPTAPSAALGGRPATVTQPAGAPAIWEIDPAMRRVTRNGANPTARHLKEAYEQWIDLDPGTIKGFEQDEILIGRTPSPEAKMRMALTQGIIDANGAKTPYMVDDVPRGRMADQAGIDPARNAAGGRYLRGMVARINKYGLPEIERALSHLQNGKYRGQYGGNQPYQVWWDNQRKVIADAINLSNYTAPVDLGMRHVQRNGQWVESRKPIIANPRGTGQPLNIADFEPDLGTWQAIQATAAKEPVLRPPGLRVTSPPPPAAAASATAAPASAPPSPPPSSPPQTPSSPTVTIQSGSGVFRQNYQVPVSSLQPTPAQIASPLTAPTPTNTAAAQQNIQQSVQQTPPPNTDEFDGTRPPDGYIPTLRMPVGDRSFFRVIADSVDEIQSIRGGHAPDPALVARYEKTFTDLYGEGAVLDWNTLSDQNAALFAADVASKEWFDSLPPLKKKSSRGLFGKVAQVSSDVASFRSAMGLHNWATAPRQLIVQHTGNVFTSLITKPGAITKMFNPRTAAAYYGAARAARRGNAQLGRVQSASDKSVARMGLPSNAMIDPTGKTNATGSQREIESAVLRSVKSKLAPGILQDIVSIPDAMFRDAVASTDLFPAIRDLQGGFSKRAALKAQDWTRNRGTGVMIPAARVRQAIDDAFVAHHNPGQRVSEITAAELETAIKQALTGLPNQDVLGNFANRMARDYKTDLNTIYQQAAREVRRVGFSWDQTRLDDALRHVFLYHYWTSRAGGLYAKTMLQNPFVAASMARLAQALNEEAESLEYPAWMQGFGRLLSSPIGSVLFANPTSMMGAMLFFADWQYGMEPQKLGDDLTFLGQARGLWPTMINPLWDNFLLWAGAYGGEDASQRFANDPTGAERLWRDPVRILNLASLNGDLPEGMMRDANGNPTTLPERPITDLAAKFGSALSGIVRENPQPIPNIYASMTSGEQAHLMDLLVQKHPDWAVDPVNGENLITREFSRIVSEDAAGTNTDPLLIEAQALALDSQLRGPELEFLPEGIRGVAEVVLRNISPMQMTARPEMALALRATPIQTPGKAPQELPEFGDEYDAMDMAGAIYDTPEMTEFSVMEEDSWGDPALNAANDKYNAIVDATNPNGETVNGVVYTQEQIMQMTDARRYQLARESMEEAGFSKEDVNAQFEQQRAMEEANPELAEYKGYVDSLGKDGTPERRAAVDELYATEPAFKRAMDQSPYPKGSPEWYDKAAEWDETFLKAKGERTSNYDPDPLGVEGMSTSEYAVERAETREEYEEIAADSFTGERERSVNEYVLAQRMLDAEYPGYGYKVGAGNLPSDVWNHMRGVWQGAEIDTSYITKSSHYGNEYAQWRAANMGVTDKLSVQDWIDATMTDDGSNKFADGQQPNDPALAEAAAQIEIDLNGPAAYDALDQLLGLTAPQSSQSGGQIVFPGATVDLRETPGARGSRLMQIPASTALRLISREGEWALVAAPGGYQGYVPITVLQTS
jgi:hypothetical protein